MASSAPSNTKTKSAPKSTPETPAKPTPAEPVEPVEAADELVEAEIPPFSDEYLAKAKKVCKEGADYSDALADAIVHVVECYSDNCSIAYWDELDLLALEFALEFDMMSRVDAEAAIADVETYEVLVSKFGDWLSEIVTTTKKATFTEAQQRMFAEARSHKLTDRLQQMLQTAIDLHNDAGLVKEDPDLERFYCEDVKRAQQSPNLKPNQFSIRVSATLEALRAC